MNHHGELKTIPVVPDELREQKYKDAVDDYLDDRIDIDELETEIEDALRGRIEFDYLLQSVNLARTASTRTPEPGGDFRFYGVDVEPGDVVEPEETPEPFEDPLLD